MWLCLGVISALFLGLYDVSRKHALRDNAAMPVLFLSSLCAALIAASVLLLSRLAPQMMIAAGFYVPPLSLIAHFHLFTKAAVVSASLAFTYSAMKNLPISIVSPVGASGLVWTLIGAIIIFHEHLSPMQFLGFGLMVASYYWLSLVSSREGIQFYGNRWILFAMLATVLGSASGLYDKYLINSLALPPLAVQVWYVIYLVPALTPLMLLRLKGCKDGPPFVWRWSIAAIAVMFVLADVLYFRAISLPGSLISILSTIRASCVLVSFLIGGIIFCELRLRSKAVAVGGIVAATCLMFYPA
jgi:transporter family protein